LANGKALFGKFPELVIFNQVAKIAKVTLPAKNLAK
jgi:hypothetical protein